MSMYNPLISVLLFAAYVQCQFDSNLHTYTSQNYAQTFGTTAYGKTGWPSNAGLPCWTFFPCGDDAICGSDLLYCRYYPFNQLTKTPPILDYTQPTRNRVCTPFAHTCETDVQCQQMTSHPYASTGRCVRATTHSTEANGIVATDCRFNNECMSKRDCDPSQDCIWVEKLAMRQCIPRAWDVKNTVKITTAFTPDTCKPSTDPPKPNVCDATAFGGSVCFDQGTGLAVGLYNTFSGIDSTSFSHNLLNDIFPSCDGDVDCLDITHGGDQCKLKWTPDPRIPDTQYILTDLYQTLFRKNLSHAFLIDYSAIPNIPEHYLQYGNTLDIINGIPQYLDILRPGGDATEDPNPFTMNGGLRAEPSYLIPKFNFSTGCDPTGDVFNLNNADSTNKIGYIYCVYKEGIRGRRCVKEDGLSAQMQKLLQGAQYEGLTVQYTDFIDTMIFDGDLKKAIITGINSAIAAKTTDVIYGATLRDKVSDNSWFGMSMVFADSGLHCRMDSRMGYRTCTQNMDTCFIDSDCPQTQPYPMKCVTVPNDGSPPFYANTGTYKDCLRVNECVNDLQCGHGQKCTYQSVNDPSSPVPRFTDYRTCSCQYDPSGVGPGTGCSRNGTICVPLWKIIETYYSSGSLNDWFDNFYPEGDRQANVCSCDPNIRFTKTACGNSTGTQCALQRLSGTPASLLGMCLCPIQVQGIPSTTSAIDCEHVSTSQCSNVLGWAVNGVQYPSIQNIQTLDNCDVVSSALTSQGACMTCVCPTGTVKHSISNINYCVPIRSGRLCGGLLPFINDIQIYNTTSQKCICPLDYGVILNNKTGNCDYTCATWTTQSPTDTQYPNRLPCGGPLRGNCTTQLDSFGNQIGQQCQCANGYLGKSCEHVACPVYQGRACGGQGVCDVPTGRCRCNQNYVGFSCEFYQPTGICNGYQFVG